MTEQQFLEAVWCETYSKITWHSKVTWDVDTRLPGMVPPYTSRGLCETLRRLCDQFDPPARYEQPVDFDPEDEGV